MKRINLCQITEKKYGASKKVFSEGFKSGQFKLQLLLAFHTSCDTTGYRPNFTGIRTLGHGKISGGFFWECIRSKLFKCES